MPKSSTSGLCAFLGELTGWATSHQITKELACEAMRRALQQRLPEPGLVQHSDQGSQFASNEYQMLLRRNGVRSSMSDRGNCYDNAVAESFFATLKRERTSHRRYTTRDEANRDLFEYIEVFYNRKRRHSGLRGISPAAFEERLQVS
jgi:transposase InsO family protein